MRLLKKDLLVYLGSYEDNKKYLDFNAISFNSNNLQKHLIESFRFKTDSVALLFSPQANLLNGGKVFHSGRYKSTTKDSFNYKEISIPYLNVNPFKPIVINLVLFAVLFSIILMNFRRVKVVTYNASLYVFMPLVLAKIFGIYDSIILADIPPINEKYPAFSNPFSNTWRFLARLSNRFITFNKNSLLYIGIKESKPYKEINFPSPDIDFSILNNYKKNPYDYDSSMVTFTYTGSLSERYGIRELIKLFVDLPDVYILRLYGRVEIGDFDYLIRDAKNIQYMGFHEFEEVIKFQVQSDFLIVYFKDDLLARVGNSGRLIEYFISGVPVISNVHKFFPDWILKFINPIDFNDRESFTNLIASYSKVDNYVTLLNKASEAQQYILKNNYNEKNKENILEFLILDED